MKNQNFLLLFTFFSFSMSKLYAQENSNILSTEQFMQLKEDNKMSGKPTYEGIYSLFTITTGGAIVSTPDSTMIIKNVLSVPDAVSCVFKPSKHYLEVRTKKQESINMIKEIKDKIVPLNIYIAKYDEIIYKK